MMRKTFVMTIPLLIWVAPLCAQNQDLVEARQYYDSEDYLRAQAIYEGLLDDETNPWKHQILQYNIALSLLSEGKIDEAAVRFDVLSNENMVLPQLKQRVLSNLALTRLMQLEEHIANLKNNSETLYLDYNRVFMLFYKVFQDINRADAAWCELEAAEGAVACAPSSYLQEMHGTAETVLKEFLAKNRKESFNFAEGSAKEALQQLSMSYGLALIKDPLPKDQLEKLFDDQNTFGKAFKKQAETTQVIDFERAQKYLKLSIQSLKGSDAVSSRIFAEAARFYIFNILEQIDFASTTHPKIVLENTIAKQELILLLESLRKQGDEKSLAEIDLLLPELQQSALNNADLFLKVVLAHQKIAFRSDSQEKACQCHPWDIVIPPFADGYARAELANKKLQQGSFSLNSVQQLQKMAIDYWKEALVKLNSTAKQEEAKPEKQQNQTQQQAEQKSLDKDQADGKFNDIQRMVQDMESDDRSRPQQIKTSSTTSPGEGKPW